MKRLALSDSSSSEDKVLVVGLQRYEVLELNRVLANKAQCASRGVHAMHELTVLFKAVYATRASKVKGRFALVSTVRSTNSASLWCLLAGSAAGHVQ